MSRGIGCCEQQQTEDKYSAVTSFLKASLDWIRRVEVGSKFR